MENDNRVYPENADELTTPKAILRATASEFRALHKKAKDAMEENRDAATYELRLREKARLLLALPHKLEQAIERGEMFPDTAMDEIKFFAEHATEMLTTNNIFGLGALLTHRGSTIGEPNDLEKLIKKLYPPKQPPSGSQK